MPTDSDNDNNDITQALDEAMGLSITLAFRAAATGNYALGAVVVRDGTVLGESGSTLVDGHDPTNHPEVAAIRQAAERAGSRYLPGAYLVTTLEPCPMCASAAVWAKMRGIVYGARQTDAVRWSHEHPGRQRSWRQIALRARDVTRAAHPALELYEDVRRTQCLELFPSTR